MTYQELINQSASEPLKAPFPWFGGKARVAADIWERFGNNVRNYVEPFFGSGAVLLSRPYDNRRIETVNDADNFVCNFWRAAQADPEGVAREADWPVNECDLESRHYWLVTEGRERVTKLRGDPLGYDVRVAGWWVWGLCSWIGGEWCADPGGPWQWFDGEWRKRTDNSEIGIDRRRPHLSDTGCGINRQLPYLRSAGSGINRDLQNIYESIAALSNRLRRVRVCCGDWSRVCGPSVTDKHGLTAVFLDPPYSAAATRDERIYAVDCLSVANDVREWAIAQGDNPLMRICLCGYSGEHGMPGDWTTLNWRSNGGYGSRGRGRINSSRECLWFSPYCLKVEKEQMALF